MRSRESRIGALPAAALLVAFVAPLACSGLRGGEPPAAPAPRFNYIADEQLESAMWRLAAGVEDLRMIFARRAPLEPSQRQEVIQILDRMITAADELGPDGLATNHARITDNLSRFREKLGIARDSASMKPPRYYLVGNLSGTCLACHGGR